MTSKVPPSAAFRCALPYRQDWFVCVPLRAINGRAFGDWQGLEWKATLSAEAFSALVGDILTALAHSLDGLFNKLARLAVAPRQRGQRRTAAKAGVQGAGAIRPHGGAVG